MARSICVLLMIVLAAAPLPAFAVSDTVDVGHWLLFPVHVLQYRKFTSPFGTRRCAGETESHRGIDLAAPRGSWVVAAREGTVVAVAYDRRSGWYVKIRHGRGWFTVYCHLRENPRALGIAKGTYVRTGQAIARVGSTGRSSGPHLHFALIDPSGRAVDPVPHLLTPHETYALVFADRGAR